MNDRRESADRMLIKLVQQRRLPVLGIGLGMQQLNVVNGGGIYLHLPEDMPRCIPHRDPQGGVHRHTVIMEPGTRMEEIYGPGEIRVNSYHHQGIRKLAPIFRVAAVAPDGLIEAFEGKDPAGGSPACSGTPRTRAGSPSTPSSSRPSPRPPPPPG